jgi:hypothetical protein
MLPTYCLVQQQCRFGAAVAVAVVAVVAAVVAVVAVVAAEEPDKKWSQKCL